MEKTKRKHGEMPIHIVKAHPRTKMSYGVTLLMSMTLFIFVIYMLYLEEPSFKVIAGAILMIIFAGWVIHFSWVQIRESVAIYEDGIEHRVGRRRLFARWEDLVAIRWHNRGRTGFVGIESRIPLYSYGSLNIIERLLPVRWGRYTVRIPELPGIKTQMDGCFGARRIDFEQLNQFKFGQVLYDYAPHLFDEKRKR